MKICDLAHGWALHHEYTSPKIGPLPLLVHKRWGRRTYAGDVVQFPGARDVFVALKRWLDDADVSRGYKAQEDTAWRCADKAKMAIEDALREINLWDDSLLCLPADDEGEGIPSDEELQEMEAIH